MNRTRTYIFLLFLFSSLEFCSLGMSQDLYGDEFVMDNPIDQEEVAEEMPLAGMEQDITLDLRNIEIVDALKFLATKAGINIITTKKVSGRVSFMVEHVKVKDIFDLMLRSNELAYAKQGNIYNVMTEGEYKVLFGERFSDIRQVKTFRLKYAIPEQAFTLLDTLKSSIGRVLVEPDSGTVLIMDTPEKVIEIERALATLEQRNLVKVIKLNYANAKDIEEQLKPHLDGKKVGTIRSDERSNQVIIQALPGRMLEIEMLIAKLDEKTKQVLIDAKIIKIGLSETNERGIEWDGLFEMGRQYGLNYLGSTPFGAIQAAGDAFRTRTDAFNDGGAQIGQFPSSGFSNNFGGQQIRPGQIHVGIVDEKIDFDVLIKFLQTIGNTQILSNPKLVVTNNQEARIHVGERQAYITSTTTTGQSTSTVSEEVTFVDVGIQLSVIPTINDEGFITLKVKPEISSVISTLITPSGNQIPIIDTSTAETTVMVKSGVTVVIGGLRRDEKTEVTDQVPFLSKIPLLGFFFKQTKVVDQRTELLVLLTPYIIDGEHLILGDPRDYDFGATGGKKYAEYTAITDDSDYVGPLDRPEDRIKSYREYSE